MVGTVVFPDPSMISKPGNEAEPVLEPDFLLGGAGTAGSVNEPLPGVVPLRSRGTLSLSAEEENKSVSISVQEINKYCSCKKY